MTKPAQVRFTGEICGFGTASGHRFVIGRWPVSPFSDFADVMHEDPDGVRTLFAPSDEVAEFVIATYRFDRVEVTPVFSDRVPGRLMVDAGRLRAEVAIGGRSPLGFGLRAVPRSVAAAPWWCAAIDPLARVALRGVRTRGTAGNDRREWYGATDQHRVTAVHAELDGIDLGGLTDVWPPVRFGFSSTPRRPSIVAVTTTVTVTTTGALEAAGYQLGRADLANDGSLRRCEDCRDRRDHDPRDARVSREEGSPDRAVTRPTSERATSIRRRSPRGG